MVTRVLFTLLTHTPVVMFLLLSVLLVKVFFSSSFTENNTLVYAHMVSMVAEENTCRSFRLNNRIRRVSFNVSESRDQEGSLSIGETATNSTAY